MNRSSPTILRRLCLSVPLLYLGACADGASRRDEIHNAAKWTVVEELRVGSVNDLEFGFSNIGGMALDDAGTLYVLDTQEREIRVFDESGKLIRRFGRRGNGPGEFESPFEFGLVGDTLWVSEMGGNQRVTLFTSAGSLIGTVPALPKIFTGKTGAVRVTLVPGSLEPGGVLRSRNTSMVMGSDTVVVPKVRFSLNGQVIDTVGWDTIRMGASNRPPMRIAGLSGPQPGRPALFNDEPISASRSRILVERPLATSAELGTFTVTRMDTAGDTIWTRVYNYRPQSPVREQINEAVADAGEIFRFRGADSLIVDREIRQVLAVPPFLPPVTQVRLVDDEIWLRRENVFNATWHWMVLNREGNPIGEIELPRSFSPRIFHADKLWGVHLDEMDVPWVARVRIVRD